MIDLPFVWGCLIALAVLLYVVLDGFDLGIGILFPLFKDQRQRDTMMNSVAPVWDGNETWLVLGGGGLLAAFPLAYAIVLPALYAPLIAMLLGLIFRGVAFEFRFQATRGRFLWDLSFVAGSLVAALAQGIALGALVQGIPVQDRAYAGGWWDWLTPFSLLTGVALAVGYALLGACWLVLKTEGELRRRARHIALATAAITLALIGAVSLWTPFLNQQFEARWFTWPNMLYAAPVPILVLGCAALLYFGLTRERDRLPFVAAQGLFVLSYVGLGISLYPNIVPGSVTVWDAAAPDASLGFLLVGAAVLVPLCLAYTIYSYWVFRGRVSDDAGYHH
jgi:cytochrome d ubiquinol oxidase subunit II